MGLGNSSEFGFGQRRENHVNCPSPRISSSPQQFENISETTVTTDSFFGSGWDSLVSMDSHNHTNHSSYDSLTLENQGISDISRLVQCSSGPGFNKLDQRLSCFRGGSYPETVTPVGGCKEAIHVATNQEERLTISDDRISGSSSDVKKRKRMPKGCAVDSYSQLDSTRGVDVEQQKDNSLASVGGLKENDEKNKSQENSVVSVRKVTPKQAKDSSQNADSPNDGYIHVRARRGQATNSHSLAERVRREKISERMKFLQDLVPGCNKITGKAVMLDEIINYVQSLQRQVEFLSMKLATVNPELNFDLERILSKDILQSHGGGSSGFGFCQGMTASYPHLNGFQQHNLQSDIGIHNIENSGNMLKATNTQFSSLPQISVWDNELQSVVQMGFVSNAPPDILDIQGQMKLEH